VPKAGLSSAAASPETPKPKAIDNTNTFIFNLLHPQFLIVVREYLNAF
jgi:hypothetical protein